MCFKRGKENGEEIMFGDALKKVNISLDKLKAIIMGDSLLPLCGIANPSRAHSQTVGQNDQGIPQFPGALRPADLRIFPSLSYDLLLCQISSVPTLN